MASGKGLSRTYHPAASARCDSLSRCDAIFTGEEMSCEEDLNFLTPAHLCKGVLQGAPSRPLRTPARPAGVFIDTIATPVWQVRASHRRLAASSRLHMQRREESL